MRMLAGFALGEGLAVGDNPMITYPMSHHEGLMKETVDFSSRHVLEGSIQFTALVVDPSGTILGHGVNRVQELIDPTAHAEIEAIRNACGIHGMTHLLGASLYASGEPCPMCYLSIVSAGISRVFFAVDRDESAEFGFDYRSTYRLLAKDPRTWSRPVTTKLVVEGGARPFLEFHTAKCSHGGVSRP